MIGLFLAFSGLNLAFATAPCNCPEETPLLDQWASAFETCQACIMPGAPGWASCLAYQLGWVSKSYKALLAF